MTSGAGGEREDAAPEARRWRGIVGTMLLATMLLVSVLGVLFTIGRDVRSLRRQLADVVAPASAQLSELQRLLALEMAMYEGNVPALAASSADLLRAQATLFARLDPLTAAIGTDASAALDELRNHVRRWHEGVAARRIGTTLDNGSYAAALQSAGGLSAIISRETAALRADIARAEQLESRLIISFVALAAVCLAILFRLTARLRSLVLSERRLAALAREREREIERVGHEKAAFIRGVTHDLKNPIGVIDAYGELLEMGIPGTLNDEQARMVGRMRIGVSEALRIIQDVLDMSRAESAALHLESEDLNVGELVIAVVEDYQTAARLAGVTLEARDVAGDLHAHTDAARVREILGNLITNATRHTPPGGRVSLSIQQSNPPSSARKMLSICVTDTGPGVPEHMREEIFHEFVRGTGSDGSGIGLAISRRIARALGGDLVLARTSEGSSFELVLPMDHSKNERREDI